MLLVVPVSLIYNEQDYSSFIFAGLIAVVSGGLPWLLTRKSKLSISKKDGYIIVTAAWLLFSLFGALPFVIGGGIPSFTDAFFETMSGFTTTGASILNDIESLSHGMLFWRSMTQWIGGMGIIVLSLAVLPLLGIGGMQLFIAEVPGPAPDKLHPRIQGTAKRLWIIYVIFTIFEVVLLWLGNMNLFDAICHSFTTMATGGFSTKQDSIAYWSSPYIQYVLTFFMFLAGTNFTLSYFALHLKIGRVFKNEEFRYYLGFVLGFTLLISIIMYFTMHLPAELSFRNSAFQVVSIITTTGFVTSDYLLWTPILWILLVVLMFFGGSAGSTGGSIKIMRVLLLLKNSALELKRLIHPNAVIPVRFNRQAVNPGIVTNVLAFVSFYILILVAGMIVMSAMGYDLDTSLGSVATTLGNIGPGIGLVGPTDNFSHVPVFGKWFLSFLMMIGRLELFTVLILFSPEFWRK
ncbi:MAG: TrkH family potassium uptake protein [Bacteroidales bacterium]|nr:TrkH family potassium uptake protein [Bacteroidales bacterium]